MLYDNQNMGRNNMLKFLSTYLCRHQQTGIGIYVLFLWPPWRSCDGLGHGWLRLSGWTCCQRKDIFKETWYSHNFTDLKRNRQVTINFELKIYWQLHLLIHCSPKCFYTINNDSTKLKDVDDTRKVWHRRQICPLFQFHNYRFDILTRSALFQVRDPRICFSR